MSPLMSTADNMAHNADTKGIERLNYFAMALLGLIFAVVVTLFFIAGATMVRPSLPPSRLGCRPVCPLQAA